VLPDQTVSSTSRAFEFVNQVNPEEEKLVLSLSIWELLKKELPLPVVKQDLVE